MTSELLHYIIYVCECATDRRAVLVIIIQPSPARECSLGRPNRSRRWKQPRWNRCRNSVRHRYINPIKPPAIAVAVISCRVPYPVPHWSTVAVKRAERHPVKAKFNYAIWFEAGSMLVADQLRTSFEPDSVIEFGF